jgi:hypothetical protein
MIFDLGRRQDSELVCDVVDKTNLCARKHSRTRATLPLRTDVRFIDFAFKRLFQREQRHVRAILKLVGLLVPFLQERLRIQKSFPDRRRLPRPKRSRWIDLTTQRDALLSAAATLT